jgi:hypothetical protein
MSGQNAWRNVGSEGAHTLKLVVTEGEQTDSEVWGFEVDSEAEECAL